MTLLEVIAEAATNPKPFVEPFKCPTIVNSDPILLNLKPESDNQYPSSLVQPLTGFQISQFDSYLVDSNSKLFKKLKRKLKNPNSLSSSDFTGILNSFFEKFRDKLGISADAESSDEFYTPKLIEKLGSFIGRDVMGLIIEGCFVLENWKLLETLITNKLVDHGLCSNLVYNLILKRRSDLICLCVKCFSDLKSSDLCGILKYFLGSSKKAYKSMAGVRNEWESQALLAVEKVSDKKLSGKKLGLAKEAAILLMVAYDGFSASELCMHYLLASSNVDEVVFSAAIGRLNVEEILSLIEYLGKWLRKYERFPQACPCAKASSALGLKACQWVPTLEDVVRSLGLVLDEHFSSLVLHSEFHAALKALLEVVSSLVSEGKLSCSLANLIEILKPEVTSS
ncbi:hypothetical protein Nepgr_003185 [Nepenthes gracilis]|uniref:Nucleolar protein 11 C-terminal domain-containing protein n=1 Tax=Nepenthes gracilis TaxID=150966 RepID=A0AAD3RZ11_NEPGR|nr:hypothetical protein Nepgr_003185 [Nepenthes gracilis]